MQYAYYVKGVFTLDFGPSLVLRGRDVNDIVKEHFPKSIELGFYAFLFAIVVGVPLGVIAALRHNTGVDYAAMFFSNVFYAVPSFLRRDADDLLHRAESGTRCRRAAGRRGSTRSCRRSRSGSGRWRSSPDSSAARCSRRCSRTTCGPRAPRACATGASSGLHVLRNSLIPVVTAAGPLLGFIITGSFVIELIFNIPGIGRYYVTAVNARDYSVVMGLTVLLSVIVIVANLVVDILYGDPRSAHAGRARLMVANPTDIREAGLAVEAGLAPASGAPIRQSNLWKDAWRRYIRNKGAVVAGAIFVLIVLYCIIWPDHLAVRPATRSTSRRRSRARASRIRSAPTSSAATSSRARAEGGRVSILIGFGATLAILLIGVVYGSISGFVGGRLDNGMMRFLDALYGLPYLPFAIITLAIIGATDMWTMMIALSIASWFTTARIVRGQVITLKENDYVRAAKAVGARWYRILTRHLLPNTLGVLIIAIFLELPAVILGEAFLSFIGLGISPPDPSWGAMAQEGRTIYRTHPIEIVVPSVAIASLVLCANFIADGLRDALDPRTRES